MDITRNWRLKISRSRLIASRNPETGGILLPHQSVYAGKNDTEIYDFGNPDDGLNPEGVITNNPKNDGGWGRAAEATVLVYGRNKEAAR